MGVDLAALPVVQDDEAYHAEVQEAPYRSAPIDQEQGQVPPLDPWNTTQPCFTTSVYVMHILDVHKQVQSVRMTSDLMFLCYLTANDDQLAS